MLNDRLKEYRKANRLTQQQLATALNIERSTYAYYENGKHRPSIKILTQLSQLYGISLDTLTGNNENSRILRVSDTTSIYNKGDDAANPYEEDTDYERDEVNHYLSRLTRDEQLMVLLYRLIKDKDCAIAALKDLTEKQAD